MQSLSPNFIAEEPQQVLLGLACLFLFGCTCGVWKFPGQGSNLSCSRDNTESLTARPLGNSLPLPIWSQYCPRPSVFPDHQPVLSVFHQPRSHQQPIQIRRTTSLHVS